MPRTPAAPRPTGTSPRTRPETERPANSAEKPRESYRDLVEQIVVAFILAFLVRGFAAEAFVIPTGSMAPTLMGMHKDVVCPHCGFNFTVNAADEFDQGGPRRQLVLTRSGLCGNCRGPVPLLGEPSFNGDRILVMKFLYNMPWVSKDQPKRWEVVVFHYPEEPETNYIKRLVGMPGEELRIYHGDVLRRDLDSNAEFQRLTKPLKHLDAIQMNVWDDRNRPAPLTKLPEWNRWAPREATEWAEAKPGVFAASPASGESAELVYRHLVPDPVQWESIREGEPLPYPPRPRLISDFYAYNAGSPLPRVMNEPGAPHWVGDLALRFRASTKASTGRIAVELIKAGIPYRAEIDLATGQATLSRDGQPLAPPADTPFKGAGSHDIRLINFDGRLTLQVDGQLPFGEGVVYHSGMDGYGAPTRDDLEPARVTATGADLEVTDLVLSRDIYYTFDPQGWDYAGSRLSPSTRLDDPADFPALANVEPADYPITPGHFMMLGDNSPRSADSRRWTLRDRSWDPDGGRLSWEVPQELLIGKAFFIYWPHGKPFWPNLPLLGNNNVRVPFRPNVERMKWIR